MRYVLRICLCVCVLGAPLVFAQVSDTSTFNIQVFIGNDGVPPTTPVLLSVTPVTATQINVSWSAATDPFGVAGYTVIRGTTTIATTSQLSYSDTGLTASTTYSYTVRAFDPSFNYSSSSNSIATTTPDNPPPPAEPVDDPNDVTEGTATRVVIRDLSVQEGISTSSISFTTPRPARFEIRWGRTASYELGYVVSDVYTKNHEFLLTQLESGTKYEYQIIGYNERGSFSLEQAGSFTTLTSTQSATPPNVARFIALPVGVDVQLQWQLPTLENFDTVRIVRNHLGFPQHPQDGAIVYQGRGTEVLDEDILSLYSPVYYTAFVYDRTGRVSSGAVALAYASGRSSSSAYQETSAGPGHTLQLTDEATSSINQDRLTADMRMPEAFDIFVVQDLQQFSLVDKAISLDPEKPFTVMIPVAAITGNLKSIIATFIDPTDNQLTYSFLLRINRDQSAYEATVAPLNVLGQSRMVVEIYDYEAFVVATYQAPLRFDTVEADKAVLFPDIIFRWWGALVVMVGFCILALSWWFLIARRRTDEDNK